MIYLVGQILICLLVAALIGAVIGWLLRGVIGRRRSEALEASWRGQARIVQEERDSVQRDLQAVSAEAAAIGRAHESCQVRIAELEESLRGRDRDREELGGLRRKLADVSSERDELGSTLVELRSELEGLQRGQVDRDERAGALSGRVAELEGELAACRSELTAARAVATATPPLATAPSGKPSWFLLAPEGEQDDLKKIKGVGQVLERTLNGLGIFHFRQIAKFTDEDVEWVSSNLDVFKGRIARDRWIEQANRLHLEKYDERL